MTIVFFQGAFDCYDSMGLSKNFNKSGAFLSMILEKPPLKDKHDDQMENIKDTNQFDDTISKAIRC